MYQNEKTAVGILYSALAEQPAVLNYPDKVFDKVGIKKEKKTQGANHSLSWMCLFAIFRALGLSGRVV